MYEPGVRELLKIGLARKRLFFTTNYEDAFAVHHPQFVFLCVGTPPRRNGSADLRFLEGASRTLAGHVAQPAIVITKSTVPVGTGRRLQKLFKKYARVPVSVVSNPEYLREGAALYDFLYPDKIVIGSDSPETLRAVKSLYAVFKKPIFTTTLETSELAKYAQNAFLATQISFANTLADLAERCNADAGTIVSTLKLDKRIGPHAYLAAGPGYGGSCFPKDVKALIHFGKAAGVRSPALLEAVERVNNTRAKSLAKKAEFLVGSLRGKKIALWGLTFKAGTDDVRHSPAIELARVFLKAGGRVTAYDPMGASEARRILGSRIRYAANAYTAARGSDLLVVATEWPQFRAARFAHVKKLMQNPAILDTRNFLPAEHLQRLGFNYLGVGMPYLKGLHVSWLSSLAKDARRLKKLSMHEFRQLQEGLQALGTRTELAKERAG